MYPHRIRLRGPWECEPVGLPAMRVTMPGGWAAAGLEGFRGRARFIRPFGYPGKADPDLEHFWLTGAGCQGVCAIHLNGHQLAAQVEADFAFEVTRILAARNRLEIVIQGDTDAVGLWGEIALEIRRAAFLSEVRVERVGAGLVITGKAVGVSPQPLELYILVDNRHADYRKIMPTADGAPFRVELADIAATCQLVRAELIHISSIWYAVESPIPSRNPA